MDHELSILTKYDKIHTMDLEASIMTKYIDF